MQLSRWPRDRERVRVEAAEAGGAPPRGDGVGGGGGRPRSPGAGVAGKRGRAAQPADRETAQPPVPAKRAAPSSRVPARAQPRRARDARDDGAVRFDREQGGEHGDAAHEAARAVDRVDDEARPARRALFPLLLPEHAETRVSLARQPARGLLDRTVGLGDGAVIGLLLHPQAGRPEQAPRDLVGAVGQLVQEGEPCRGWAGRAAHPGVMRTITTPWAGTTALNRSVKVPRSACAQRSRTRAGPACRPMRHPDTLIAVWRPERLRSTTAFDPSLSGFAHACSSGGFEATSVPCTPAES